MEVAAAVVGQVAAEAEGGVAENAEGVVDNFLSSSPSRLEVKRCLDGACPDLAEIR
jgi:hypothetical protein